MRLTAVLAPVIALAILFSAVAMWYDTLKIHATIETGSVDVEFGDVWCEEVEEAEGKDVGSCSVKLDEVENEGPGGKNDLDLNITVVNAYPGYSALACFEVVNSGTIPVVGPYITLPKVLPYWLAVSHGIKPVQIDPGASRTFCFWFSILEDIEGGIEPPGGYTYAFQVYLDFIQWNEVEYEVLGLRVDKEFRYTDVYLEKTCPHKANLDGFLPSDDGYYVVNVTVVNGKVKYVNPGAFFGVIWVEGVGVTEIHVIDSYEFHFNVEDGKDGKVRAYIYDKVNQCIVKELKLKKDKNYTIDNANNVVKVDITLTEPLGINQAVLIYLKFKPSKELIGSDWATVDKYFDNNVEVTTNIGSSNASATIKLVGKKE
ncbi:MAG: hypothetical protein QW422_07410 [Sulfolobales archaeon]